MWCQMRRVKVSRTANPSSPFGTKAIAHLMRKGEVDLVHTHITEAVMERHEHHMGLLVTVSHKTSSPLVMSKCNI